MNSEANDPQRAANDPESAANDRPGAAFAPLRAAADDRPDAGSGDASAGDPPPLYRHQIETRVIHGVSDNRDLGEPVAPPIVTSTSFHVVPDAVGFSAADLGGASPLFYARWGNPTVALLERQLAGLEGGAAAVAFGSGMGAVSALFLSLLRAGDHLVLSDVCYAGVAELALQTLPRFGIEVTAVDSTEPERVAAAIRPGVTRLVHVETPANPTLQLTDIAAVAAITQAHDIRLSVDSTIATPIATRPLEFGADFVVHSLTKYLCGHGDTLGGAIVCRLPSDAVILREHALIHHGAVLSPFAAWLILRGIETLAVRMRQHQDNARVVARFLGAHRLVSRVHWPGLDEHPQAELARRQMANFSGLLSFTVHGDERAVARRMADRLSLITYAVSLGKTRTLVFHIPTADLLRTSLRLDGDAARKFRDLAGAGVFRLSVGLEHADDIVADLARALDD
ncbi:MAG: PLP-dependent aspartate aminotransferase family protein [Burkholderiaceae bacterium]